jgi:hypothetical protein
LVGAGGIILVSFSVGAGGALEVSFAVGVLVPSSDPSLVRSIKSPPTLLLHFSISLTLARGVGGGSILLLSGDGGGMGISWSAGGTAGEMVWSQLG